jgi:hypothetical protein
MARKKKIEFVMDTDWMFEKPIDREHKEYKLLSYFQRMGEKLDNMKLYPGFIELSLHLANIQTLIRDKKIIYTNKKFNSVDDELLVKDLKVKSVPDMSTDEYEEFTKILQYTAPRMLEYFNIAKSVWTIVFDSIETKYRKNKKEILSNKGFFFHLDKRDNKYYVWEYEVSPAAKKSPESKTNVKLIYCDDKNKLTIPKIITTFSEAENKTKLPVLEMISRGDFPIEETLLPLFKRKTIMLINQARNYTIEQEEKKKEKEFLED